jgi:hypothetical protein
MIDLFSIIRNGSTNNLETANSSTCARKMGNVSVHKEDAECARMREREKEREARERAEHIDLIEIDVAMIGEREREEWA